ncbi:unnamed protein product [Phytophthora fragariaefolia]|uniref:Unnamed protein product n=1 Tax=Phytophthora fragariaefolia TaxID=1490495 RepID=A0A9W6XZK5_9STRA|nr:unnamed protein product [Phytophthora fragariaefolia]
MNLDSEADDPASQVMVIKGNVIGKKTVAMYSRSICRYVAWIYNNKRNVLSDSYLAALHEENLEQDEAGIMSLKRTSVSRFIADHPNVSPINYASCPRF